MKESVMAKLNDDIYESIKRTNDICYNQTKNEKNKPELMEPKITNFVDRFNKLKLRKVRSGLR